MGNRASIGITQWAPDNLVWLYTHWYGPRIVTWVQETLARRQRWDDGPYLARMVFERMLADEPEPMGETNLGICTGPAPDANQPYLIIDTTSQTVKMVPVVKNWKTVKPLNTWSFEEFAKHGATASPEPALAESP
jgi:hypothetical protein